MHDKGGEGNCPGMVGKGKRGRGKKRVEDGLLFTKSGLRGNLTKDR